MKTALISIVVIILITLLIILASIAKKESAEPVPSDSDSVDEVVDDKNVYRDGQTAAKFKLDNLSANDTLKPGYIVKGSVPGNWFFEATAPYTVVNWDGLIIGQGFIQATGEWMTTDPVPFFGGVNYELDSTTPYTRGSIIFHRHNASGLPEHDEAVEIPVELVVTD